MALSQQVGDLKLRSACTRFVASLHTDETETDSIGRIPPGEPVDHGVEGDVGVFVLVAAEDSSLRLHHADHIKRLAADAHLLAERIA
ncbi:MAG: Uncharacterised protein [Synechococcus sp. CC9902]|nr:MAG: Uncharacterised protein [Synechococcus sp. CC9902]